MWESNRGPFGDEKFGGHVKSCEGKMIILVCFWKITARHEIIPKV